MAFMYINSYISDVMIYLSLLWYKFISSHVRNFLMESHKVSKLNLNFKSKSTTYIHYRSSTPVFPHQMPVTPTSYVQPKKLSFSNVFKQVQQSPLAQVQFMTGNYHSTLKSRKISRRMPQSSLSITEVSLPEIDTPRFKHVQKQEV